MVGRVSPLGLRETLPPRIVTGATSGLREVVSYLSTGAPLQVTAAILASTVVLTESGSGL